MDAKRMCLGLVNTGILGEGEMKDRSQENPQFHFMLPYVQISYHSFHSLGSWSITPSFSLEVCQFESCLYLPFVNLHWKRLLNGHACKFGVTWQVLLAGNILDSLNCCGLMDYLLITESLIIHPNNILVMTKKCQCVLHEYLSHKFVYVCEWIGTFFWRDNHSNGYIEGSLMHIFFPTAHSAPKH